MYVPSPAFNERRKPFDNYEPGTLFSLTHLSFGLFTQRWNSGAYHSIRVLFQFALLDRFHTYGRGNVKTFVHSSGYCSRHSVSDSSRRHIIAAGVLGLHAMR